MKAKLDLREGTLKGVLWHQGESDTGITANANSYGVRLARMIHNLRADLAAPDLPFVAGELGEFLFTRTRNQIPYARVVNDALVELPSKVPGTGCVSASGLKDKGDELHFDSASERDFGRQYAAEMLRLLTTPAASWEVSH